MGRSLRSSARRSNSQFANPTEFQVGMRAENKRLYDLCLAMVIPWRDGWPRYWLNDENESQRMREILDATEDEILPWEL